MKIRRGFVSNSSSSSFLLISKEKDIPKSPTFNEEEVKKVSDEELNDFYYPGEPFWGNLCDNLTYIDVDASKPASYLRDDIKRIDSIKDKVVYLLQLYAYYYQEARPLETYFVKMSKMATKLRRLGRDKGYFFYIRYQALQGREDSDFEGGIYTWVDVNTECSYVEDVVDLMEDEDTTNLESFIFNPHSFAILGGDEYTETYSLTYKARQEVDAEGYPYYRVADYNDIEKGSDPDFPEYEWHWGMWNPDDKEKEEKDCNND